MACLVRAEGYYKAYLLLFTYLLGCWKHARVLLWRARNAPSRGLGLAFGSSCWVRLLVSVLVANMAFPYIA